MERIKEGGQKYKDRTKIERPKTKRLKENKKKKRHGQRKLLFIL
jgi:hypothetical protein